MNKLCLILLCKLLTLQVTLAQSLNSIVTTNNTSPYKTIKGTIYDDNTRQPIEYATIALLLKSNTTNFPPTIGSITNAEGQFSIIQVPAQVYTFRVSLMGYANYETILNLTNSADTLINVGNINLKPEIQTLKDVQVLGNKSNMQVGIDKKVFNVEKTSLAEGGSASTVLQNIPSVTVDIDGNVSMRGSGNLTILIDGKPSSMGGGGGNSHGGGGFMNEGGMGRGGGGDGGGGQANKAALLEQIPASSIKSIEIISNPSSRYDAEGTSGIINIILKKNETPGFNGVLNTSAGNQDRYNTSLTLNYKYKKINIGGNYSFRQNTNQVKNGGIRNDFFSNNVFEQDGWAKNTNQNYGIRHTIDYAINPKNNFSAGFNYGFGNAKAQRGTFYKNTETLDSQSVISYFDRTGGNTSSSYNYDITSGYRKTFSNPQHTLTFDGVYSFSNNEDQTFYDQYFTDQDANPLANQTILKEQFLPNNTLKTISLQADYVQPLAQKNRIEFGAKMVSRKNDVLLQGFLFNDSTQNWQNNTQVSNQFLYTEYINSLYAIYGGTAKFLGGVGYQAGLRYEHTNAEGVQVTTNQTFTRNYGNFFPSFYISKNIAKQQDIRLSYAKRINRPSVGQLNPFPDYADRINQRVGNPELLPEIIHAYEASYIAIFDKITFNGTLYWRQVLNSVGRLKVFDTINTNYSYIISKNLYSSNNIGIEAILKGDIGKKWNYNISANFFRNSLNGSNIEANLNNDSFSWNAKATNTYTPFKGFEIQAFYSYSAPIQFLQGNIQAMHGLDVALKQDLLHRKLTLTARVSDVFNTRQFNINLEDPNTFKQYFFRKANTRQFFVGLIWRFGTEEKNSKPNKLQKDLQQQQMGGEDGNGF